MNICLFVLTMGYLLPASVCDVRSRRVPRILVLAFLCAAAGVSARLVYRGLLTVPGLFQSLLPGTAGILCALVLRGQMGLGDGLSLLIIGLIMGAEACWASLFLGLLMIGAAAIILLAMKKAERGTKLPFLPFLSLGVVLACTLTGAAEAGL